MRIEKPDVFFVLRIIDIYYFFQSLSLIVVWIWRVLVLVNNSDSHHRGMSVRSITRVTFLGVHTPSPER
jgi:hypothetical protein